MFIVYTQPSCRFSKKVFDTLQNLGLKVESRDISNLEVEKELLERGGEAQTHILLTQKGE